MRERTAYETRFNSSLGRVFFFSLSEPCVDLVYSAKRDCSRILSEKGANTNYVDNAGPAIHLLCDLRQVSPLFTSQFLHLIIIAPTLKGNVKIKVGWSWYLYNVQSIYHQSKST